VAATVDLDRKTLLLLEDLGVAMERGGDDDAKDVSNACVRFFGVVAAATGDSRVYRTIGHELNDFARVSYLVLRDGNVRRVPSVAKVIAAIAARDPEQAAEACRSLLDEWSNLLTRTLLESDALTSVDVSLPSVGGAQAGGPRRGRARQATIARPAAPAKRSAGAKAAAGKTARSTKAAAKTAKATAKTAKTAKTTKATKAAKAAKKRGGTRTR
jgi:hypothetical protein